MEKELGFAHFLAQVDGVGISVLVLLLAILLWHSLDYYYRRLCIVNLPK